MWCSAAQICSPHWACLGEAGLLCEQELEDGPSWTPNPTSSWCPGLQLGPGLWSPRPAGFTHPGEEGLRQTAFLPLREPGGGGALAFHSKPPTHAPAH